MEFAEKDHFRPMKTSQSKTPRTGFFRRLINSFRFAFAGIGHLLRTQQNAWIHAAFTVVTMTCAGILHFKLWKWIALVIVIGLVWTAEACNTAFENLVDLLSPSIQYRAKAAKDLGAAAVLLSAIAAAIVGLLLFIPPIINILGSKR